MNEYFLKAEQMDGGYREKINQFRNDLGDHFFIVVDHVIQKDVRVAKSFFLEGITACPFHRGLQRLLAGFADQDLKDLIEADAKGRLGAHKGVVQYWMKIMTCFPYLHSCLTNEHMGFFCFFNGKISLGSGAKDEALCQFKKSMAYLPLDGGLILKIADLLS